MRRARVPIVILAVALATLLGGTAAQAKPATIAFTLTAVPGDPQAAG